MKHLTLSLFTIASAASLAAAQPVVDAPCGSVQGIQSQGVRQFRGIPYAEPPTGDRRWRAPLAKRPWSGVRDCSQFGPVCPQADTPRTPASSMSEDCLNLNVWTPKQVTTPLPVMVWVHGGAFVQGAGSLSMYEGTQLASRGVVVVTINYRVGPLGFIAHPALSAEGQGESGNYGVQDVIQALRWVQTNARAFGGDPSKVTVFGQSAGGAMGRILLVSPPARGLFQRVIMESGPAGHLPHLTQPKSYMPPAEQFGVEFAERVLGGGVPANRVLSELRRAPVQDLIEHMGGRTDMLDKAYTYGPVIGGKVLPQDPFALMAQGKHANVPVIVGATKDEGATFKSNFPSQTPREFYQWVQAEYGPYARALLSAIGPVRSRQQAKSAMGRLFGDERFVMISRLGARQLSQSGSAPVYLYAFTRGQAGHGAEIPYVFGDVTSSEQALSEQLQAAWVRFARTGDPNGGSLPQWPTYAGASDQHLELGDAIRVGSGWRESTCDPLEEKFLRDRDLP